MAKQSSLRSVLYVPADNARALDKVLTSPNALGADAVVFDLEDAVAPERKQAARESLRNLLNAKRPAARVLVRINALQSDWGTEDFLSAIAMQPDAIVLPKVETVQDIAAALSAFEASDTPEDIKLWAMIESPMALMNLGDIAAQAHANDPRLEAFMLGTNDLSLSTGLPLLPGRAAYLPWIMQCLAAARAYGLSLIDGVFNSLDDGTGFEEECRYAALLGLDGKSVVHPKQVEACNRAFMPSADEISQAQAICEAFADPANAGKAVLTVNSIMVEFLHLKAAQRILLKAGLPNPSGDK